MMPNAIIISKCDWCGEPFIQLNTGHKPRQTCSVACHTDNFRYVRTEGERARRTAKAAQR